MSAIKNSNLAHENTKLNRRWLNTWSATVTLWLWGSVGAGLIAGLATIAQLGLMARIIQLVVVDGAGQLDELLPSFAGLLLAVAVRALAQALQGISGAGAARSIREQVRKALLAHWQYQGPVELAGESSAALASEWVEHVDALEGYFARFQPQLWLSLLIPFAVLIVVFSLDWLAALFLLAAAPLIPFFMILVGMGAERLNQQHFASASQLAGHFLDRVRGLTTLQLFGQSRASVQSVAAAADQYRRLNLRTLRVAFLSSAVLEFFSSVAIAVVAIYVGFGLLGYIEFGPASELSLFSGLFVLLLAPEFFQPLRDLSQHYHDRATALGAADHLRARLEPTVSDDVNAPIPNIKSTATAAHAPTDKKHVMMVKDLAVAYPGRGVIFKGLSFEVAAGQSLALTGPSGSGKTSVLNVLAGFCSPTGGSASVFGEKPGSRPLAWMNQRPFLVQGSWADNLRITAPNANAAAMTQALQHVGLADVLAQQPLGLDTPLGEGGRGLSGGQGHRLALARLFLSDVKLALLDEPTAGLDPYSRQEVIAALRTLSEAGITIVMATHQAELIAMADRQLDLAARSPTHA